MDDLAYAVRGQIPVAGHVGVAHAVYLGPCFEYLWMRRGLGLPSLRLAPPTPVLDCLRVFVESGNPVSQDPSVTDAPAVEVSRVPDEPGSPYWVAFLRRVQIAARQSGFGVMTAAGIAGAVGEMASNAVEHSGRPATAVMAYRGGPGGFEFVVADAGMGVRASLRQCPEFRDLTDSAEALALCIQEGVSRHGVGVGRGLGFGQLFGALADLNALVRLRGDDQALTMEGRGLGPLAGVPTQRPVLQGFIISMRATPLQAGAATCPATRT